MCRAIGAVMLFVGVFVPVQAMSAQETPADSPPPVVAKRWAQEPDGFGDVKFGTPYSVASQKFGTTSCKRRAALKPSDVVMDCLDRSYPLTDKISVIARFRFVKGSGEEPEFNGVELEISNRRITEVKAMMFDKYGPPMLDAKKVSVAAVMFGTGEPDQVFDWRGDDVKVRVVEPPQPLARSVVTIERISDAEKEVKQKNAF